MLSNWSSFVPDLIVGAVTGSLVALALYIFERRAATERRKAEARAVSRRLVHPLLMVLQRPRLLEDYTSIVPIPKKSKRALELIENADLDLWHEIAASDLTANLWRFRSALWDLETDAENLHDAVRRWSAIHSQNSDTANYATAKLLGAPRQYLEENFADPATRPIIEGEAKRLLGSKFVKKHAAAYRRARGRVERAQESLVQVLIIEIRARHSDA
ncbi:hypothetical protein ABT304_29030 [Nocardioides sp. NPDC000445]|uniref:hypothetical protein n=1 Tax=Nocardioides sp. NPDC000445 TaxID=3154257 RepID=UPI00331B534B